MKAAPGWVIQVLWWLSAIFATGAVWYFLSTRQYGFAIAAACAALLFAGLAAIFHRKQDALLLSAEERRDSAYRDLEKKFLPGRGASVARQHTPIPSIGGHDYDNARQLLVDAGWQPLLQRPNQIDDAAVGFGNGPHFWNKGYRELRYASGTGLAHCRFDFVDVYGNRLAVVTSGEVQDTNTDSAGVCRWFFAEDE